MRVVESPTGKTHDVLRAEHAPLDAIFSPKSVAVIGATERTGTVGQTVLWNLLRSPFGGTVYPVNPKRASVMGVKAYPKVSALPEPIDLAVIATPAPTVPGLIGECIEEGVRGAIILSAGFKEIGPEGAELERQILEQVRRDRIRVIGPNCLGVMNPLNGLNATFSANLARPGSVGMVSQSGALLTAILDWSLRENVGFSRFVSIGSMLDVGWGDLIDELGSDPHTRSIVLYMESIGDAGEFLSAAREVALTKPILVIKAGRTEAAARAAASHTGSLTGSDEVLDAAFRRCGVLRVGQISDLFNLAEVLAKQPRPRGPRLSIITNAGGPGVLATDTLIDQGAILAELAPETRQALDDLLPPHWSRGNPIDVLGDAGPDRYAQVIDLAARDPNCDGLLVILTPTALSNPTQTAERLRPFARIDKPVLASWMGGVDIAAGEEILNRVNIPTYHYPDTAAHVFATMWQYSRNLRALYETPAQPADAEQGGTARRQAAGIIAEVLDSGRTILTEFESKRVLEFYRIPIVSTRVAVREDEAVGMANAIGYPVVLKLHSETITHKSDVGGVRLNLADSEAVRKAFHGIADSVREHAGAEHFQGVTVQPMIEPDGYELIVGSSIDPQVGPVLLFGTGGPLVEVIRDRSLGLPPLNSTLARRMMERTQIYQALNGVRGRPPVDLPALERLMVRFGRLVVEQPRIREIDINPLLATPNRLVALDARIILHGPEVPDHQLPRPAIRPYPTQYVARWTMRDGTHVLIRPIRPEDEPLMARFHETLSAGSVYLRFFHMMKLSQLVAHDQLTRFCFVDYNREMALVAEYHDPATGTLEIVGAVRLSRLRHRDEAEFSLLIGDAYQGRGLGRELLRRLMEIGRDEGVRLIVADILPQNLGMQRICESLGFRLRTTDDHELVRAEMVLEQAVS